MFNTHNNNLGRREFLQGSAAALTALSSGAMFSAPSGRAEAADTYHVQFDTQHLRWGDEVIEEVKRDIRRAISGRLSRDPLQRMIKPRYDALPTVRKARFSRALAQRSQLTRRAGSGRSAAQVFTDEMRQPRKFNFDAPQPLSRVARRVGRTGPRIAQGNAAPSPQASAAPGQNLDFYSESNPHNNAGAKYDLGDKYKSLEKIRDKHGRLLTRQRWRKGGQNSATYYMGRYINGGKAVALVGNTWTTYKSMGDAEGPLGAPLRTGRHDSGYYSGGVYIPTAKDPAVETFFGRMIFKDGKWRGELLKGFQLILNRITVDSNTGDDLNGFSDLRINCYTTQGDVRIHGKTHSSFLYSGQVAEPHAVIGEANLQGNAAVLPGGFGYFIQVIEKDQHKLAESLVKKIEEKLRAKLEEGAKKAGYSLAAALKVPALASLLTELFALAFNYVADKVFGLIEELFKDDYSDVVSNHFQLWSAWHPFKDPYWVKEINHNNITIHSGGKDGQVDLKVILSRVWKPA